MTTQTTQSMASGHDTVALSSNPLLVPVDQLIDYSLVKPEHVKPAIEHLLQQAKLAVEKAADPALDATWDDIVAPLETATEPLWRAWTVIGHLKSVMDTPELRQAYNDMLGPVTEYSTWVSLHEGLFRQYLRLQDSPGFKDWPQARQRVVNLSIRDFRLGGVELKGEARERYAQIAERESQLAQKFSENVLDANDSWSLVIDDVAKLSGIPEDAIESFKIAAESDPAIDTSSAARYKITLKMPSYLPVMQYANDRELRHTVYKAYATLASDQGDPKFDNSAIIEETLALRAESSRLLGYQTFASLRLETRMADSAQQVLDFLRELAHRALPYARRDLADLQQFARTEMGMTSLEPWDIAYVSERLRKARYDYSEEEIKQYFTEPKVVQGLFDLAQTLFSIRFSPVSIPLWREDTKAYQVESVDGRQLGYLILDLYARQGKQGGAWVNQERYRRRIGTNTRMPVVYLTCNFAQGREGKPALLTHDDVITLFHEAGHALHALLGEVDEPGASAFAAVEWDAIELPSQFMENFCWEYEVLKRITSHVDTDEPLPRSLFDKLKAARNYQSGMQTVRQVEFALFDMLIHNQDKGMDISQVMQTLDNVRQEVAVIVPPEWHRFPHAFSHLFAGGYAAGYYSYKWAEVLSADAYAAFEEAPTPLDPVTGAKFRDEILAVGGLRPAAESFRAFRGREPSIDALLRHHGMVQEPVESAHNTNQ